MKTEFLNMFIEETNSNISELKKHLENLDDPGAITGEQVAAMRRAAHTIKGSAAMLELQSISTLSKNMEYTFRALENNEFSLDKETVQLLSESLKALEEELKHIPETHEDGQEQTKQLIEKYTFLQ